MTQRFKYGLYLFTLCLLSALSLKAQYSEEDLLSEANVLFDKHEYAEAMPLYAQLLSLNPTKPEFNYKYGATALYGDADKKEEAIKFLKYASTKNGIDPSCWYFLGKAYHLNYQFADAINAYEKYKELGDKKNIAERHVDREIEDCQNGQNLLSNIKEVTVLSKNKTPAESFFRIYDLSDIGGKILVTPDALLSTLDKKRNHRSLILFRGTGTTVYFSSYGKDGKTGLDIYRAEVLPGGEFSSPVKLGPQINTPFDEDYPFLHPDNTTFYFSSKGHSSMGGYDIFSADLDKASGTFTNTRNLDFAINTPDDDLFYVADSAKKMANFASSRSSKQGELDVYKVLVKSAPAEITMIKGRFSNKISPENKLAKITVVDASTNAQIDVQYTDPNSGDYVLSFPRSGRFKFLVEAQDSKQVHSGIVTIPKSSGIRAYLQEMELVSNAGVEKLLINNLFDQIYDGDVTALAQRLLRQRAALDVNFNTTEEPEEPAVEPDTTQSVAMAYNAAGFGAGMSNEKVLEKAQKRTDEIAAQADEIDQLKQQAMAKYFDALTVSNAKTVEAKDLIEQANQKSGDERSRLMFEAGIAKLRAGNALKEAENSKALVDQLSQIHEEALAALEKSNQHADSLGNAISSGNYDLALNVLKSEKSIQENTDKSVEKFNPEDQIREESVASKKEAGKYLDRASAMRAQTEELQRSLITKNRQFETAKGKDKDELSKEIVSLKAEIKSSERKTDKAFEQANKVQKEAFDKAQQYDIFSELNESSGQEAADLGANTGREIQTADLDKAATEIADLPIDNELVSSYMQTHPEAGNTFENDQVAIAFKREYASSQTDSTLLAVNQNGEFSPGTPANSTEAGQQNRENADAGAANENVTSENEELADNLDGTINNNSNSNGTAAEIGAGVTAGVIASTSNQNRDSNSHRASETAGKAGTNTTGTNSEEFSPDSSTETTANPQEVSKEIEAEQTKISAAEDWIAIIDASIAELEDDVAANETESNKDAQAQLDQYKELRAKKENEVAESKSIIASLEETDRSNAALEKVAVANAETDIDTLSASLVSRLEMKSNESATDIQSIKDIRAVDSDYLPALASIELSGVSDPEIATRRIELNKKFIATINRKLAHPDMTDLSPDRLLELRRMKTIEIQKDRKVQIGELAYEPLTPEARDYKTLVAGPGATAEKTAVDSAEAEAIYPNMSPELAEELQTPFSRDLILSNYSRSIQDAENQMNDSTRIARKLEVNQDYLKNLRTDIEIYSAAIASTSNEDNKAALEARYDQLLQERSAVVDEINQGHDELAAYTSGAEAEVLIADNPVEGNEASNSIEENSPSEELTQNSSAETPETKGNNSGDVKVGVGVDITAQKTDNTQSAEGQNDIIAFFDSLYTASANGIADENLDEVDRLNKMSVLNASVAFAMDSTISQLMTELDDPTSGVDRDKVQAQIQELDAIAADKRQEADRLRSEAEFAATQTPGGEVNTNLAPTTPADSDQTKLGDEEATTELNRAQELIETPEVEPVIYKSLNANIAFNAVASQMDSLKAQRREAQQLVEELKNKPAGAERQDDVKKLAALNDQIQANDTEINKVISNSNAAEISYFQSANDAIMAEIHALPAPDQNSIPVKDLNVESSQLAMLLSENESKLQKGEISELEKIQRDLRVIEDLNTLNTRLDTIAEAHRPEIEAVESITAPGVAGESQAGSLADDRTNLLNSSTSYEPEKGKMYITPIYRDFESKLSDVQKADLKEGDETLKITPDFAGSTDSDRDIALLGLATKIDEKGVSLLKDEPDQMDYLTASIKADSLKKIESLKAAYARNLTSRGKENLSEIQRLENAIVHEDSQQKKAEIKKRIDRLRKASDLNFERASIAAFQAEDMRIARKKQEEIIAQSASKLARNTIAELNFVLENKTYTVVPSDLASTEIHEVESPRARDIKPIEKIEPKAEIPSEPADKDFVPVNENLDSIDEKLLLEAHGNWLNVVEVIAEKDDFSDVKESLFIDTDQPVYSDLKPIPLNPALPDGLIFQVQVGAFRNNIPQDLFGEFAPIMGEKLSNGITRYRAGVFRKYRNALEAKTKIRSHGYSDAFVVAYINGERLTGAQAQDILRQAQAKEGVTAEEIAQNKAAEKPNNKQASERTDLAKIEATQPASVDYYADAEAAKATQVEVTPGLFFTVQVGVYSKPVKLDKLYNLVELNSELTASGYIRYTTGRYESVEAAEERKAQAIAKGVTDAFITAYYNGKRISLPKANELLATEGQSILSTQITTGNNSGDTTKPTESEVDAQPTADVKYVVVLGSYSGDIPQNVANVFLERSDLKIRRVTAPNGISIYASPEFDTKADALDFLKLARSAGIDSAVMGKVVDGKISAVEAK